MAGGLPGSERVRCPRCGANNFPGTAQCWQCQASLPPPEAIDQPYAPPPLLTRSAGSPSRRIPSAVLIVALVAAVLAALTVFGVRRWSAHQADRRLAELNALKERLLQQRARGILRQGDPSELDPTEAQARREIRRLEQQLDQMPLGGGGDVRLRGGGAMSAEEYERWRRELRGPTP